MKIYKTVLEHDPHLSPSSTAECLLDYLKKNNPVSLLNPLFLNSSCQYYQYDIASWQNLSI